jgi:putative flippase GtrA
MFEVPPRLARADQLLGRGSLFRNSVAGFVATVIDFAVVSLLVSFDATTVPAATLFGCVVGGLVNLFVNRVWAFGSDLSYPRQVLRYALVSGASALLNSALVALLLWGWTGAYQPVWLAARGMVYLVWNYPLHRYYVFTREEARDVRPLG